MHASPLAAVWLLIAFLPALAQRPVLAPNVAALRTTAGPPWKELRTQHFVLYDEEGGKAVLSPQAMADSLEDAWQLATRLLRLSAPATAVPGVPKARR